MWTVTVTRLKKALIDTNQLQLIYSPKISSTDKNQDEDEEKSLGYEFGGWSVYSAK